MTSPAPKSRMRVAMCCESLVVSAHAARMRRVSPLQTGPREGVTRMSEPQAEPASRPGTPKNRCASRARAPCEVR